jgi:hypothetical protein
VKELQKWLDSDATKSKMNCTDGRPPSPWLMSDSAITATDKVNCMDLMYKIKPTELTMK